MSNLNNKLMKFLQASPTPYHAVFNVKTALQENGFTEIHERNEWQLQPGGRYYVCRRDASIIAFKYGKADMLEHGLRIIGAHTDSPTLKVKPRPEIRSQSYLQLGIEVYGGALLNPWFDRDLSLAGRVTCKNGEHIEHHLLNFQRPIAVIPSLAIHLDRNVNAGRNINPQEHMNPILLQSTGKETLRELLQQQLAEQGVAVAEEDILEHDLCFYDVQPPSLVGLKEEFLASARIDNLLSSFIGLEALLENVNSDSDMTCLLGLYDHEEVGSQSDIGANGNMLPALLERLCPDPQRRHRILASTCLWSVDNAHGIHPNFANRHDERHGPLLNKGPVIKVDANQSYATSTETAGLVQYLAAGAEVPLQRYVTRADMRCGSTIGPMSAAKTGIKTVDIGVATFAMHSVRELAGADDPAHLKNLLVAYLKSRQCSF